MSEERTIQKAGHYDFVVEPFQEDFTGRMTWGVLGNHLLKCASMHANEHGFGLLKLQGQCYAWVLSRLVIEMKEMPVTGEPFSIETWIHSLYRLFTDRCFAITSPDGRVFGYAYSIWALINTETRRPAELENNIADDEFRACLDEARPCPIVPPGRIRIKNAELVRELDTYYSDIDINNHVNSIRYVEMMLDLFPKDIYAEKRVSRLEVAYSAESYCGERLSFYRQQVDENTFVVEIRKESGEVACKGELKIENLE